MSYDFKKVSILIVEDNMPMLSLTKALLEIFGAVNVLSARNGDDGFRIFCKEKPDIVIADWMMKPTDGIALTLKIRNDPDSPNPFVPIILMTGFSEKRRVIAARDAGVTEFLMKPFNARDLYRRIAQIIEKPREFVKSDNFFGPDRRRIINENYAGPMKRIDDHGQLISMVDHYIDNADNARG